MSQQKIDTSPYDKRLEGIFRNSVFSYQRVTQVMDELHTIKDEAFNLFKEKRFFDAASFYKSLLDHGLDYLTHVNDVKGKVSAFIFECISFFSQAVKQAENIDKEDFFDNSVAFYLEEDLGFADEVVKLILDNCEREHYEILEEVLNSYRKQAKEAGSYTYDKFILLYLRFYRKFQNYSKYLEVCKWYPSDKWERYIFPAEIYEAQQQWEQADHMFQEGLARAKDTAQVDRRYTEFKRRMGLI